MCGIAGIAGDISKTEGENIVRRMNSTMTYRGPDEEGIRSDNGFAFGMRRLSIIDLSGGSQPIWGNHGDGVVFNGEIYNYLSLRKELEHDGYTFKTNTDTEVIPNLYHRDGIDAFNRLEGMFGICIYSPEANKATLVRDRMGIKPLYYFHDGKRFYFASEIKAILSVLDKKPDINNEAIYHYLTLRYVPGPETIWKNVFRLEPGCFLELDLKSLKFNIQKYWNLDFNGQPFDADRDYTGEFTGLFLESVEKQLVASDVPVGVLLSGGLDSACVSAAAVEMGHRNFHTFTVDFEDGGEFSEIKYARELAEHIGSRHSEITIGKKDFIGFLPEMVGFTDEPLADLASVPMYFVSRLAREKVKVVLTGEGSDEILAGYILEELASNIDDLKFLSRIIPPPAIKALSGIIPGNKIASLSHFAESGINGYLKSKATHITDYWNSNEKASLLLKTADCIETDDLIRSWYDTSGSDNPIDQIQQVYCKSWLVEDLLMKADRMSMANSLELRVPFLEHPIIEWASKLPVSMRVGDKKSGYVSKRILRNFASGRVPQSIIDRPKQGFPVPAYKWLSEDLSSWARNQLSESDFIKDYFNFHIIGNTFDKLDYKKPVSAHKIWILLILKFWADRWVV
ncbi:MAG TPA: asparagine synthase (glutamine-hydrolyzing) [bacterium]|nr:asparagine synthase (glutamine-hydrolyzing) [bacterium]